MQVQVAQLQPKPLASVPGQRGLEQRAVGQTAWRPQALHHLLERQVLMLLSLDHLRLDARQQGADVGLTGRVDAHGKGVDEQADQFFDFAAPAVGHRHADHHLGLS